MLSYRQLEICTGLHPQTDSRYTSIGGSLSLDNLTTLEGFMNKSTQLVFGFDNDDKGARYGLTALVALSKDGLTMTQASQQGYIALQVPTPALQDVFSKLIEEHTRAMQTYMPQASEELDKDITKNMFHWRTDAKIPTLEIPINTALLNTVNNQLIQHGKFTRTLAIVRARGKDFNEDLKAEQLRQVKRPILVINLAKGQIVHRAKSEEEAWQFIETGLLKNGKLEKMPIGTELQILKSSPKQLVPTSLGQLRVTAIGLETSFTDTFKTQANRQKPEPKLNNEQTL